MAVKKLLLPIAFSRTIVIHNSYAKNVRDGECDILGELKCSVVAELWALICGSP